MARDEEQRGDAITLLGAKSKKQVRHLLTLREHTEMGSLDFSGLRLARIPSGRARAAVGEVRRKDLEAMKLFRDASPCDQRSEMKKHWIASLVVLLSCCFVPCQRGDE